VKELVDRSLPSESRDLNKITALLLEPVSYEPRVLAYETRQRTICGLVLLPTKLETSCERRFVEGSRLSLTPLLLREDLPLGAWHGSRNRGEGRAGSSSITFALITLATSRGFLG